MTELWTTLIPLAIATAILPGQIAITVLMLRAPGGRARAGAWIGGMTVVRLAQFVLMFLILEPATDDGEPGTSLVEAALLLVVAVLLLVSAARKAANQPDEDAPPPRWMPLIALTPPPRAFLAGAGIIGLSPKQWVFSLGVIGAIGDAELAGASAWLAFLVFVALAQSIHLAALILAVVAPDAASRSFGRAADALERHSRPVMIGVSLVFGAWFLLKALRAFGLL